MTIRLAVLTLVAALAACGGSDSSSQQQQPQTFVVDTCSVPCSPAGYCIAGLWGANDGVCTASNNDWHLGGVPCTGLPRCAITSTITAQRSCPAPYGSYNGPVIEITCP